MKQSTLNSKACNNQTANSHAPGTNTKDLNAKEKEGQMSGTPI